MQTIILYKYSREDGGVTTSPVKPDVAYSEVYRLVADEGKALTKDGVQFTTCTDVASVDGWYEVDAPDEDENGETSELATCKAALNILGVQTEVAGDAE